MKVQTVEGEVSIRFEKHRLPRGKRIAMLTVCCIFYKNEQMAKVGATQNPADPYNHTFGKKLALVRALSAWRQPVDDLIKEYEHDLQNRQAWPDDYNPTPPVPTPAHNRQVRSQIWAKFWLDFPIEKLRRR